MSENEIIKHFFHFYQFPLCVCVTSRFISKLQLIDFPSLNYIMFHMRMPLNKEYLNSRIFQRGSEWDPLSGRHRHYFKLCKDLVDM